MNHEIMTIEEVAEYVRVSERTVYDWAQKGELPGGKIGTTWRFKRSDIESWVNRKLGADPVAVVTQGEGVLSLYLTPDRVVFLDGSNKTNALKTLCAVIAKSPLVPDEKKLQKAIFQREDMMSTGIGFGIGVPHVRLDGINDLVMALGVSRVPLKDYASLDDVPVQIVCMVAAGRSQHPKYIRTLSVISARLKAQSLRSARIVAASTQEVFDLFTGENK